MNGKDYSNYRWYKGEDHNPWIGNQEAPLAASLWEYERNFHQNNQMTAIPLAKSYNNWKREFIESYLPGKSPNPYGDNTDWAKVFETGKR